MKGIASGTMCIFHLAFERSGINPLGRENGSNRSIVAVKSGTTRRSSRTARPYIFLFDGMTTDDVGDMRGRVPALDR